MEKYRPNSIKMSYETEIVGLVKKFWSVDCIPRLYDHDKKTEIAFRITNGYKANYLFMGYTGRKGPK